MQIFSDQDLVEKRDLRIVRSYAYPVVAEMFRVKVVRAQPASLWQVSKASGFCRIMAGGGGGGQERFAECGCCRMLMLLGCVRGRR